MSDVSIDKFVNRNLLTDPWAGLEASVPTELRGLLRIASDIAGDEGKEGQHAETLTETLKGNVETPNDPSRGPDSKEDNDFVDSWQ